MASVLDYTTSVQILRCDLFKIDLELNTFDLAFAIKLPAECTSNISPPKRAAGINFGAVISAVLGATQFSKLMSLSVYPVPCKVTFI